MSNLIPGNCKHLTLDDRLFIEKSLNEHKSFREIAKYLCKDPSTISKEVWKHRIVNTWNRGSFNNPYNFCIHRYRCRKTNACDKLIICDTLCEYSCAMKSHFRKSGVLPQLSEYYGAAEPPVRCGEVLPQLSVFWLVFYLRR